MPVNSVTPDAFPESGQDRRLIINPVPVGQIAGRDYYESCVFIGDEILKGLGEYGITDPKSIFADEMMTVSYLNSLREENGYGFIMDFISERSPVKVYLLFGPESGSEINADLLDGLGGLTDEIKNSGKELEIFIISFLPVTASGGESYLSNSEIDKFNSLLLNFSNGENVFYLDINTALKGNGGGLSRDKAEFGGTELKKETYAEISDYILSHVP